MCKRHLIPHHSLTYLLSLLTCIGFAAACDRAEGGTGRLEQKRCSQDGVCWQSVGKHSLEGAYRKGENEIKFDVIYSPGRTIMTQFKDEWSIQLLDQLGLTFFSAPSSNPPDSWQTKKTTMNYAWNSHAEEDAHLRARSELAYEMAQAVLRTEQPSGKMREPWKQLCGYLQERIVDSGRYGPRTNDSTATPATTGQFSFQDSDESMDNKIDGNQSSDDPGEETGEYYLDNDEQHEELANGVTEKEAIALGIMEEQSTEKSTLPPTSSIFAFSQAKNKKTNPAEHKQDESREYQQEIDLYSKNTRSFLMFGWKTGKHHSAACITLKQRLRDSNDPWEQIGEECTENHGSKARTGDMRLYATCRNMPITKGFYVWKGECGGKFPTHYCNDDTALQIRHAYGIYDDGSKCLKRKRTHRPWCERPW